MTTRHSSDGPLGLGVTTRGACVWFTGLSGAGKTTTARCVADALRAEGHPATILDGDEMRASVSANLGFSRADRTTNVVRVAAIACDLVERGEIVLCSLVSPYRDARARAREIIGVGRFVEVFVDTPLGVCEGRDCKGLYARARRGEIARFTGIDDPYETPLAADLVLTTTACTPESNAAHVVAMLEGRGLLPRCNQTTTRPLCHGT